MSPFIYLPLIADQTLPVTTHLTHLTQLNSSTPLLTYPPMMSPSTPLTRAVLTPVEGRALIRAHCAAQPPLGAFSDRAPACLSAECYNSVAHGPVMRRTLHTIPMVVSGFAPGSHDDQILHTFRRHSYTPCPRRASEPLW
ncbi:hypothetical protein B0H15DRAFT_956625 [Mycena belliarum]|uniref:Uncharacterized protein n=1 Tax=Mycena belliarum TaxID=1033014 RepID=A0AAD6TRY0_9AGAR|nr:hypothetical protein B0H15DRAFT_956625 [Mycena belliae]